MIILEIMNWKEFLPKLLRDFRLSSSEFEAVSGVSNVIVSHIKNGKTERPTQNTIKKIEKALNIAIDDSDPENITYSKIEETRLPAPSPDSEVKFSEQKLVAVPIHQSIHVHAGTKSPVFDDELVETLYLPKVFGRGELRGFIAIGDSMNPVIEEGDYVIVSLSTPVRNREIAVIAYDNMDYVLKGVIFNPDSDIITLVSKNPKYDPMFAHKSEIISMLPVVNVVKGKKSLTI